MTRDYRPPHALVFELMNARKRNQTTQQALARLIGRGRRLISVWESGGSDPSLTPFVEAVEALGGRVVVEFPEVPRGG